MSVGELPSVLQVEEISPGRYRVNHPAEDPEARNVVFSGQILTQMIMASDHGVDLLGKLERHLSDGDRVHRVHRVLQRSQKILPHEDGPMDANGRCR